MKASQGWFTVRKSEKKKIGFYFSTNRTTLVVLEKDGGHFLTFLNKQPFLAGWFGGWISMGGTIAGKL
jgi:hypothetical protein